MDDHCKCYGTNILFLIHCDGYLDHIWFLYEKRSMKKEVSIKGSKENVEIFDTAILIMAGLMTILAVFSFSGEDMEILKAGPSLMFITIPKVFASMRLGTGIGIIFFLLVLFAAITSSIVLTESAVSTFQDELHCYRKKSTII